MKDIKTPHDHDVLSGRGGATLKHVGNYTFRYLVSFNKEAYVRCCKSDKRKISRAIVEAIRKQNPPGRFLAYDRSSGFWSDIGDKKAIEKTSQALREGRPDILRNVLLFSPSEATSSAKNEPFTPLQMMKLKTNDTNTQFKKMPPLQKKILPTLPSNIVKVNPLEGTFERESKIDAKETSMKIKRKVFIHSVDNPAKKLKYHEAENGFFESNSKRQKNQLQRPCSFQNRAA